MKKFLSLALLITFYGYAQDYNYLASLNKISGEQEVLKITNEIVVSQPDKLRMLTCPELSTASSFKIRFVPEKMTDNQYYALEQTVKDELLTFSFTIFEDKIFKFEKLSGTYSQIFNVWKQYYNPEITEELAMDSKKARKLIDLPKQLYFYIEDIEDQKNWRLINRS
jgi:hypothetical protein